MTIWQFSLRGLLRVTAVAASVTAAYCVAPPFGFLLAIALAALFVGNLLREKSTDCEAKRACGVVGSIAGGAIAGVVQWWCHMIWIAVYRPENVGDLGLGLPGNLLVPIPYVIGVGAIIGLIVWVAWCIVGIWFQAARDLIRGLVTNTTLGHYR